MTTNTNGFAKTSNDGSEPASLAHPRPGVGRQARTWLSSAGLFAVLLALGAGGIGASTDALAKGKGKGGEHHYLMVAQLAQAAPVVTGRVSRLLVNPFGEIDGLLIDGGRVVTFPPHMGSQLATIAKVGDEIAVQGLPTAGNQFKGYIIRNVASSQSVTDQRPAYGEAKMPKHIRALGLKELKATGKVIALRHGKRGEVHGVVFEDGTSVRFAKEAVWTAAPLLQIGREISVVGYGSETAHGRGIEATALAKAGETPQPIFRR